MKVQCDRGLPKPDLVCFMDTQLTSLDDRANFGEERYETTEFQKLVYQNFNQLFDLKKPGSDCLVTNARDTIENLHSSIFKHVDEMIQNNKLHQNSLVYC